MTNEEYELMHQAIREAYEACCEHCNKRYWECYGGIYMFMEQVDGCKKALDKYTERYNKKLRY